MVLLSAGIAVMGLLYAVYFRLMPLHALSNIVYAVLIDYFLFGYVLSTGCWYVRYILYIPIDTTVYLP